MRFQITDILTESDINVSWKTADGEALGHCSLNLDKHSGISGAGISIGLYTKRIEGIDYDTEIYHGILHCVGVALGVSQTDNPDDIMCIPHQYGKIELSENDKKAIYDLYNPIKESATNQE